MIALWHCHQCKLCFPQISDFCVCLSKFHHLSFFRRKQWQGREKRGNYWVYRPGRELTMEEVYKGFSCLIPSLPITLKKHKRWIVRIRRTTGEKHSLFIAMQSHITHCVSSLPHDFILCNAYWAFSQGCTHSYPCLFLYHGSSNNYAIFSHFFLMFSKSCLGNHRPSPKNDNQNDEQNQDNGSPSCCSGCDNRCVCKSATEIMNRSTKENFTKKSKTEKEQSSAKKHWSQTEKEVRWPLK